MAGIYGAGSNPIDILGFQAKPFVPILTELFPRFGKRRDTDDEQSMRISRRNNLVRLLYLGNPPKLVSRREVENVWGSERPNLASSLGKLKEEHRLREFLGRADDIFPSLSSSEDLKFWSSLSKLITRNTDWIGGLNYDHAIADDASMMLLRQAVRKKGDPQRAKAIFHSLRTEGDLALTPFIFRKHLFQYGLTKHSDQIRGDNLILSKDETIQLIDPEIKRYKEAVLSGYALKRLPNLAAIFAISNLNFWEDELRQSLTDQLMTPEAISTFSMLIVPPGFGVETSTLEELFDTEAVAEIVHKLGKPESWCDDPHLLASTKRLIKSLSSPKSGDPFNFDDE